MTKIIKKTEMVKDDDTIDNELELMKFVTEVKSRIKDDINSDFVLAKFEGEKDKTAIQEMTNNAYISKRHVEDLIHKNYPKWNKQKKVWIYEQLDQEKKDRIKEISKQIFDTHMIRLQMKAILNRNKENNPILSGIMRLPKIEKEQEDEETILQRMKDRKKKKDDNKKEDGEDE